MISSNGIVKKIRLGDDVETRCGRCKENRLHQVVALGTGGVPERVICKTCNSEHKYRAQRAVTPRAVRSPRAGSDRSAGADIPPNSVALDYSPKGTYLPGNVISHPKFGTGKVVDARAGKIDVKFGTDVRTLLHAG
jgi:hypothetical protein